MTRCESFTHSTNSNGPVPAPFASRSSPAPRSWITLGETIMPARSVRVHRHRFDVEADAQRAALLRRIGGVGEAWDDTGGGAELQERPAGHCRCHRILRSMARPRPLRAARTSILAP